MECDKDTVPENQFAQTRVISPLTITSVSKRRSLFSRSNSLKDDETRPASADAFPENRVSSSTGTRIPRLAQHRSSFTLTDAYRLAQEEEEAAAQGSPSPAPRSWRSRRESSEKNSLRLPNVGFLGSQHRRTMTSKSTEVVGEERAGIPTSLSARSLRSNVSESSFDEKIRQHTLTQRDSEAPVHHSNSTSSKAGFGTKILETGRGLVRRSSRGVEGNSSPRNPKTATGGNRFSGLLSRRKRESSSSTQTPDLADWIRVGDGFGDLVRPDLNLLSRPTSTLPGQESPEKSYAWDAENDFTAGDLQVSNSPPLNLGRSNTKIDEIRALEAETSDQHESYSNSWKNNRIDEIRDREAETTSTAKSTESTAAPHEVRERNAPKEQKLPILSRSGSNTDTKMDGLKSREIESVSRRAITTAQLGKIRERNAELTSRSPSPDVMQKSSSEPLRSFSPPVEQSWRRRSDAGNIAAQTSEPGIGQELAAEDVGGNIEAGPDIEDRERQHRTSESAGVGRRGSRGRDESQDVLPRLSAAAATGHVPDLPVSGNTEGATGRERQRQPSGSLRQRMFAGAKGDGKPTVGFVGLRRNDSIESNITKRSSFILSESDPTERIEGEMNLFAPQENQSEGGSLRALSPEPVEEASHETPKPTKPDPLTMPTPRVTGAFVETPAMVKVEKKGGLSSGVSDTKPQSEKQDDLPTERGRRGESVPRKPKQTQSSRGDRMLRRSSSLSVRHRARSLSRSRSLINSAKPPTVRDDILEIQRANQIEDSTLDDIADLLLKHDAQSHGSDNVKIKTEIDSDNEKESGDQDAKRLRRMSESLQKGIMSIRTAKQGIQRLEDQVAQGNNIKSTTDENQQAEHTHHKHDTDDQCPICRVNPLSATTNLTYVHLPLPRLWNHHPSFRLTFLGLCVFLLSLWYVAESWMCHLYCKPPYCAPGEPCDWDIDYPTWGYTIPTKLDEWATGGQGKEFVQEWYPEVTEWVAGLLDTAMSNDPESSIASRWSRSAKRRRRKRMLRKGSRQRFERGRWGWKRESVSGMVGGEEKMTAGKF